MPWMIFQLLSYSPMTWLVFVAVAYAGARMGRIPGVFLGHILIAMMVFGLDLHWVHSEMERADWDGAADYDIVLLIGVVLRVLLINTLLMLVSIPTLVKTKSPESVPDQSAFESR